MEASVVRMMLKQAIKQERQRLQLSGSNRVQFAVTY
jgi:hypothetical protein